MLWQREQVALRTPGPCGVQLRRLFGTTLEVPRRRDRGTSSLGNGRTVQAFLGFFEEHPEHEGAGAFFEHVLPWYASKGNAEVVRCLVEDLNVPINSRDYGVSHPVRTRHNEVM